jgi:hypothetical protein
MLALTDAALARICIGATRIHPGRRQQWLREIAAKLDPPGIPLDLRGGDREAANGLLEVRQPGDDGRRTPGDGASGFSAGRRSIRSRLTARRLI